MFSQKFINYILEVVLPSYLNIILFLIRRPWKVFLSFKTMYMAIGTFVAISNMILNPLVWIGDRYSSYLLYKKQQELAEAKAKASAKAISVEDMKNLPIEILRKMEEAEATSPETIALEQAQRKVRRAKAVKFVYGLIVYAISIYGFSLF